MQKIIPPKFPPLKKQKGLKFHKKGFTLVELIVVITILSILSTIGFVSYSGYLSGVRDTTRIRALEEIEKSMQVYSTNKNLPKPDNYIEIKEGSKTISYQGEVGQTVIETVKYSKDGKDPKDKEYYSYYLTKDRKHYQLMAFLEEESETSKLKTKNLLAIDYETRHPHTEGKKLGILTDEKNNPINKIETIKTAGNLDITDNTKTANLKSYLKTNESFTGSTNIEKLGLIAKVGGYGYSVSSTGALVYVDYSKDEDETLALTDWRNVDPNCDIADITVGTQTWAGCNSTIGNGFEFGKRDNGANGTVGNCYKNHQGSNNASDCVIGSTEMASATKSNTWFTGTNSNGDKAPANIWGKYYTWDNASTACKDGYHLPSDSEWTTLENTLAGTNCRTGDVWQCDPIGWKSHNTKNTSNSIVQALKLPLAGLRDTDGATFYTRGLNTTLWSSSLSGSNARGRRLIWNYSTINRHSRDKTFGFSVRCIKD